MMNMKRSNSCGAFTLVEVLLALSVSSIIGLVVLLMLSGVASASQKQHDTRQATMNRQVAIARLSSLTRCTAMVLACDDDSMVLWKGDINANGKPELSELRRIEWDSSTNEVKISESPAGMDVSSDVTYAMGDDFKSITIATAGSATFPTRIILRHVQSWTLTLDQPAAHDARLLRLDVELHNDQGSDTASIISALRASGV